MTATLQSLDVLADGESSWGFTNYEKLRNDIDLLIRSADGILSPGLYKLWDSVDAGVTLPAVSITTPALPQTFKHLYVEVFGRTNRVATSEQINLRFNGDAGANYDFELVQFLGTTFSAPPSEALATVGNAVGFIPAANVAILGAGFVVEVPGYSDATVNKTHTSFGFLKSGTTTGNLILTVAGGSWRSTAAISTVTIYAANGSSFIAPTRITVYGKA